MSNTEAELKLRLADPACLTDLLKAPLLQELAAQGPDKQLLETTYYDTAGQRLLKSRLSYRLRLADGKWTATVKADGSSDGGLHQRFEYNLPVDSPVPSITPFLDTEIGERLSTAVGEMSLEPVFSTRFERHTLDIVTPDGSSIELAVDNGDILAGDKQQKLLELELELKSGQSSSLIWLGAALAEQFPLLPEQDSKLYRATILAGLADELGQDTPLPFPVKKANAALPARQVLSQLIIYNIHQAIRAQQAFLSAPDAIATLYNLRLAVRKLRTLLRFAKPLLPADEYAQWQDKLAAWNTDLGSVRDLDVFSENWVKITDYMSTALSPKIHKAALTPLIDSTRIQARAALLSPLAAGQFTPVLLGLWWFMTDWAQQDELPPQPAFKEFSLSRLTEWLSAFLTQGDELALANQTAVHNLRLAGRQLRYLLEELTPILPDSTQLLSKRLASLHDLLGNLQDFTFTLPLLKELVKASASRLAHHDAGLITGWQLAQSAAAVDDWAKIWGKVKKAALKIKKLRPLDYDTDAVNRRSPELY